MSRLTISTLAFAAVFTLTAHAQTPDPALTTTATITSPAVLLEQGKSLLEKARTGSGSAGVTLENYKDHHTMLSARTKSGGGEFHGRWADFLIVLEGEGTELTGGTLVDPKPGADGEIRGTRLEGATSHILHKGDILHIPAGTPHQAIMAPGQSILIFVIKVEDTSVAK
jgi:mannose-6-phosphate isomerase-like protein (cupin superfamily)